MPRPSCGTIDVHTHKDGRQTFYLRMTVDGRRRRVRLGTDRAGWTMGKAMVALEEQLATVRTGTWRPPDEPDARSEADDPTFRTFASSWLEDNMLEWRPNTVNAPLVTETNAVLSERGQPKLPDGITAHSLRKTYFTLMHYSDAIPRWLADQGGHRDPSTTLGIYTEALRGERGGTARRSTRWSTESHLPRPAR